MVSSEINAAFDRKFLFSTGLPTKHETLVTDYTEVIQSFLHNILGSLKFVPFQNQVKKSKTIF